MTSLAELLFDPGASRTEPVVHWRDRTCSRGEIADAAQRLADTLRRMGAAPDSAVAAVVPSTPLGIVMCFGIWRAGAVAALLAPSGDADVDQLLGEVRPSVVMRPSLDEESLVPQLAVRSGEPRHYDDALALIATVPGGSGPPRRAMLTHDAVVGSVASARGTLRGGTVQVIPVPLGSAAGLDGALVAVAHGGAAVLVDPFSPGDLAESVRRFAVETAMLTAEMIVTLGADPTVNTLAPLRYVRSVDRPVTADEARRFRARFGVTVLGGYGRPELGGEVVGWTVGDAAVHGDVKLGSVGRPYPGVEARIVRVDRTDAGPDEAGELWIRSPYAMAGYASDRLELRTRIDDRGFVHTGERGRCDRDGFLWIDDPEDPAGDGTPSG